MMVGDAGPGVMPGLVLYLGAQGVRRMKKRRLVSREENLNRGGASLVQHGGLDNWASSSAEQPFGRPPN